VVTSHASLPVLVNAREVRRQVLRAGDALEIGRDIFRVVDAVLDAQTETPAATTDSARMRVSRKLSAEAPPSGPAAADGRPGLLGRMGMALSTRAERGREEELQHQRRELLAQIGRRALAGDRFGLPAQALADLLAGRAVRIDPGQLDRPALEWWAATRDRIALMDAEIAALRQAAGLGPDPQTVVSPTLRAELRQAEEQAYATLDGHATQGLDGVAPTSASGRRRAIPVRRRRP
jgi:hypothetical protein